MKDLIKYSGIILQVIGVALLLIPKLMGTLTNSTLVAGGSCIVLGIILYVVLNRLEK